MYLGEFPNFYSPLEWECLVGDGLLVIVVHEFLDQEALPFQNPSASGSY
jgi:hypothetical protein